MRRVWGEDGMSYLGRSVVVSLGDYRVGNEPGGGDRSQPRP